MNHEDLETVNTAHDQARGKIDRLERELAAADGRQLEDIDDHHDHAPAVVAMSARPREAELVDSRAHLIKIENAKERGRLTAGESADV